jgi:hypothetical protein
MFTLCLRGCISLHCALEDVYLYIVPYRGYISLHRALEDVYLYVVP